MKSYEKYVKNLKRERMKYQNEVRKTVVITFVVLALSLSGVYYSKVANEIKVVDTITLDDVSNELVIEITK